MKLLVNDEKALADQVRAEAREMLYRNEADLVGQRYVVVDRSRNYTYPDDIKYTTARHKGK